MSPLALIDKYGTHFRLNAAIGGIHAYPMYWDVQDSFGMSEAVEATMMSYLVQVCTSSWYDSLTQLKECNVEQAGILGLRATAQAAARIRPMDIGERSSEV